MAVRPEFGPTLPALLRARRPLRRAFAAGTVAVIALVVVVLIVRAHRGIDQAVVHGTPTFNVVYDTSVLHRVAPHAGDLLRLEGAKGHVRVVVSVRAAHLPAYAGKDVVAGLLPALAEGRERQLRALYGPLQIFDEGRARTNGAPGYQIGFRAGTAGHLLFGRDVYAFPDEIAPRTGVLISLRQFERRKPTAAENAFLKTAKNAFHSFTFGEAAS